MRLGLITDVHNDARRLSLALNALRASGVDQVITMGDTFDPLAKSEGIAEAVELLEEHKVIGVWGNHDICLCDEIPELYLQRFPEPMFRYLESIRPRLEIEHIIFSHREVYVDRHDVVELWDLNGEEIDHLARAQKALTDQRYSRQLFVGHYHQWMAFASSGPLDWKGTESLKLSLDQRYFIVVAAVCDGWCATLDTDNQVLEPIRLD